MNEVDLPSYHLSADYAQVLFVFGEVALFRIADLKHSNDLAGFVEQGHEEHCLVVLLLLRVADFDKGAVGHGGVHIHSFFEREDSLNLALVVVSLDYGAFVLALQDGSLRLNHPESRLLSIKERTHRFIYYRYYFLNILHIAEVVDVFKKPVQLVCKIFPVKKSGREQLEV